MTNPAGLGSPGGEDVVSPYQDPRTILLSEPRIHMLKTLLEEILRVVELECDGHPVAVNGFRLRNLEDWVTSYGGRISPTLLLDGLAAGCNVSCRFSINEVDTRLPNPQFHVHANGNLAIAPWLPIVFGNVLVDGFLPVWKGRLARVWTDPVVLRYARHIRDTFTLTAQERVPWINEAIRYEELASRGEYR